MKLKLSCIQCHFHNIDEIENYNIILELRDDNLYTFKCENGHESTIYFGAHKFELLFEMGVYSYLDGYYREAITNFAAAIERFHEFSIELFTSIFYQNDNDYSDVWKQVSNQSERQLGAYTLLYYVVFKKPPIPQDRKWVEFRNNIIHKGKFPTQEETFNFANATFKYIKEKLVELKMNHGDRFKDFDDTEKLRLKHKVAHNFTLWRDALTFKSVQSIDELDSLDLLKSIAEKEKFRPFTR